MSTAVDLTPVTRAAQGREQRIELARQARGLFDSDPATKTRPEVDQIVIGAYLHLWPLFSFKSCNQKGVSREELTRQRTASAVRDLVLRFDWDTPHAEELLNRCCNEAVALLEEARQQQKISRPPTRAQQRQQEAQLVRAWLAGDMTEEITRETTEAFLKAYSELSGQELHAACKPPLDLAEQKARAVLLSIQGGPQEATLITQAIRRCRGAVSQAHNQLNAARR